MKYCKQNHLTKDGTCIRSGFEPCLQEKCNQWQPWTNFDNIKAMSVEELTAFIIENTTPDICSFCVQPHCFSVSGDSCNDYERIIKEYLESEVQGE